MNEELNEGDISILLESMEYSKMNIRDGQDSTPEQRDEKLKQIDTIVEKLRLIRDRN